MRFRFAVSFAALFAALLGGSLAGAPAAPAGGLPSKGIHLALGNPSKAKSTAEDKDNYLMRKEYFALSYNNSKGTPNWVSWYLSEDFLGTADRKNKFDTDDDLPDGFSAIAHKDYTNSGFHRGHMCPHSDRAADKDMSFATFVMTNIVPQSPECNTGSWESLESYCRHLVTKKGKELFVVAGPIGKGGEGDNGRTETLAGGKVTVPAKVFKVIIVLDKPDDTSDPKTWVDEDARLIAVIMPNDPSVEFNNWPKYRVSVKDVEDATGLKFFDKVQDKIAAKKAVVDAVKIPKLTKKVH